jgi:hypothetical protein
MSTTRTFPDVNIRFGSVDNWHTHSPSVPPTPPPSLPLPPLPIPNRRHSITRPLKSSPLARPAFSSECNSPKEDTPDKDGMKYHPPRISSAPEIHSHREHLGLRELRRKRSDAPLVPSGSVAQNRSASLIKRDQFNSLKQTRTKQRTETSSPTPPPTLKWTLKDVPAPHAIPDSSHVRRSLPPLPTSSQLPSTNTAQPSSRDAQRHRPSLTRAVSRDPDQNWITRVPYSSTPRFSRLSLASPNVVLPVPACSRKRSLSRTGYQTNSPQASVSSFSSRSDSETSALLGRSYGAWLDRSRSDAAASRVMPTHSSVARVVMEEGAAVKRKLSLPKRLWRSKTKTKSDQRTSTLFLPRSEPEKSMTFTPPIGMPSQPSQGVQEPGPVKRLWRKISIAKRR